MFFFLAVHLLPDSHFILTMSPDEQEHPEMHMLLVPVVPSLLTPQAGCSPPFDLSTFPVFLGCLEPFDPYKSDTILVYPEGSTRGTPLPESPLLKSCILFLGRSWYPTQSSPTLSR